MQTIEIIKEYISNNKDKLNLSFNGSIVRENDNSPIKSKVKLSERYNDKSYSIIPFYKKITRFL